MQTTAEGLEALLRPGRSLRQLEGGILSALPADDLGAPYDSHARVYDFLIGSRLYNRIMWGLDPAAYARFIAQALASRGSGVVIDVAAGSCLTSAALYPPVDRTVIVLDRSVEMLRRGAARLAAQPGPFRSSVFFVQGDAYDLPFRDDCASTVLCHGAVHVLDTPERAAAEWRRVLDAGGSCFASSLVTGRPRGDRYLRWLQRQGGVAALRSSEEFAAEVARAVPGTQELRVEGSFAFLQIDPLG